MRIIVALFLAALLVGCQIPFRSNELSGVVTSANGPEAGVRVIAETTDLPTRFAKIVVTDERGRYWVCAAMAWWTRRRSRQPPARRST
jgi:hypothetical protein